MKERPILFSAPMVRSILEGRKTMTRRVIKPQPVGNADVQFRVAGAVTIAPTGKQLRCPYGAPGDRLYLKEAWRTLDTLDDLRGSEIADKCLAADYPKPWAPIQYEADGCRDNWLHVCTPQHSGAPQPGRYRHAKFMPRWASRITLEVTEARVERLNEISAGDCWAEGIPCSPDVDPIHEFQELWESIYGSGSWGANPLVWAVGFKRVTP